jgi:hypothetical protein
MDRGNVMNIAPERPNRRYETLPGTSPMRHSYIT